MATKICSKCLQTKLLKSFHVRKKSPDGLMVWCKICTRAANRESYCRNREQRLVDSRKRWKVRRVPRSLELRTLKAETMAAYGGVCQCCNESILEFLTLDHEKGDGWRHRKRVGSNLYRWLKELGFPQNKGLRVLCYNCNCGRERSPDKRCPHELLRVALGV